LADVPTIIPAFPTSACNDDMERSTNTMNQTTATPAELTLKAIARHSGPLALWHLLSLDAPTVAVLWTWFIASANHVRLPLASTLTMFIAVWMLYAADRLLDARLLDADPGDSDGLEARHYFHHRHRSAFLFGIFLGAIALALLLPHIDPQVIHLYLVLGGLVSAYFILIHATRTASAQQKVAHFLPKEIAVGLFFAAATFIPTIARCPNLRSRLLPFALLFAALCGLNCLFIYAWEHAGSQTNDPRNPLTHIALRYLSLLSVLLALSGGVITLFDHQAPWHIPYAIALSAALLLLLHNHRLAISPVTLRAAADLALTTPLILLLFLRE
jgi:hypothetical protein